MHRDEESAQTIISGMGELHLEIYIERMKREYACEVIAGKPQVAYRETITPAAASSTTPTRSRPVARASSRKVAGYIEPLPAEHAVEHYEFVDDIVGRLDPARVHPGLRQGLPARRSRRARSSASRSSACACVINDGASHAVDSSEMAFKTAALMGFREAYASAKPTILEPIMKVEVQAPEEFQGSVVGQLNQRRGTILDTENARRLRASAMAEVPLNDMFGYSTDLRSATQGKGEFTMEFQKYAEVPKQEREVMIAEYRNKKEKA